MSDPNKSFSTKMINYEDPNLNVSIPVFSIHGNHDDPTGQKQISAMDLLASSGLVNYFGRCKSYDEVVIEPICFRKGQTKLALYGLSHIKDERLGRLFLDRKVSTFLKSLVVFSCKVTIKFIILKSFGRLHISDITWKFDSIKLYFVPTKLMFEYSSHLHIS